MPRQKTTDRGVEFGCDKCGTPHKIYPPDSEYMLLKSEPCKEGDSKPIKWTCDCGAENIRYWDKVHYGSIAVGAHR